MNLQQEIDRCAAAGGGRVAVPPGVHTIGTLFLRENVELHIPAGATLRASEAYADYPAITSDVWCTEYAPRKNPRCLIYAENARGVAITGSGTIDCDGKRWCEPDPNPGRINALRRSTDQVIPRVVCFVNCENFTLRDFTLRDAPAGWSVWLTGCSDGVVDGVRLLADPEMPNADGLHINCCRDIRVANCRFETGDDALVLRAYTSPHFGKPIPCERITVTGCTLASHSSGVRIGWSRDGCVRDCVLSDLVLHDCVNGIVVQLPCFPQRTADQGDAVTRIERISFRNILMDPVFFEPIHLSIADGVDAQIRELTFDGVTAVCRRMPRFSGTASAPIEEITLRGCRFTVQETVQTDRRIPDQYWDERSFDGLPMVRHVRGLHMENLTLDRV